MKPKLTNKKLASALIVKIRDLNTKMAADQFEMSKLLYTLHAGSLHIDFGYVNYAEFIEHELPVTYSYALTYVRMYKDFRALKYNKAESIELLERVGVSKVQSALRKMDKKASIAKMIKDAKKSNNTITIHLSANEMRDVEKVLMSYGLDVTTNGRRTNMRETLLTVVKAAA